MARRSRLALAQLEDRVVPALFAVELLSPEAGDPGDTFATHAGRLWLNPAHPTDGNKAVVEAGSATEAVEVALSGAVVARVAGRQAIYSFAPASAGTAAADKLPFLVRVNGELGTVRLEDLARMTKLGADRDYDDRSWRVDVRPYSGAVQPAGGSGVSIAACTPGSGPVIYETDPDEPELWSGPGGDAEVTVKVTYESDDTYLWHYKLKNLNALFGEWGGIGIVHLATDQWAAVIPESLCNSKGWYQHIVPGTGNEQGVWWESGEFGEVIPPLDYGEFWFKTEPRPVATALGEFADPNYGSTNAYWTEGPGETVLDIDIDTNRDGAITNDDEATEDSLGTVLVADRDNVYKAPQAGEPDERAWRKEMVVHSNLPAGSLVRVKRTEANVRLYTTFRPEEVGGNVELFGANDEIDVKTETTYFLGGGNDPSSTVRGTLLKARPNQTSAYQDQVSATVLWVDISGETTGLLDPYFNANAYDRDATIKNYLGHDKLGVVFGKVPPGTIDPLSASGFIRIDGQISPIDFNEYGVAMPTNFVSGVTVNSLDQDGIATQATTDATADFGFIARRYIDAKVYKNGQGNVVFYKKGQDNSTRAAQDPAPDRETNESLDALLVVDVDGPSVTAKPAEKNFFKHARDNFTEYFVFNYFAQIPERASAKVPWYFSGDVGIDYLDKPVFVVSRPNDGAGTNEVKWGSSLPNLLLNLPQPTITNATTAFNNKVIRRNLATTVTITGTNLVGEVYLDGPGGKIEPDTVKVKRVVDGSDYSDLTEMRAVFTTNVAAGVGYTLYVKNATGQATAAGFSIE